MPQRSILAMPREWGPRNEQNLQLSAMAIVWGGAVGMIALSIPLAAILQDSAALLLPLAVIVGATIVTSRIWSKSSPVVRDAAPLQPPRDTLRLEERLANLETILTREDWSLKERIERLENK